MISIDRRRVVRITFFASRALRWSWAAFTENRKCGDLPHGRRIAVLFDEIGDERRYIPLAVVVVESYASSNRLMKSASMASASFSSSFPSQIIVKEV